MQNCIACAVTCCKFVHETLTVDVDHYGADSANGFADQNTAVEANGRMSLNPIDIGHGSTDIECHGDAVAGTRYIV